MEQQLTDWFILHPFTRNLCLLAFGALCAGIRADRAKLHAHRETDPTARFAWRVAIREYVLAMLSAMTPPIVAVIYKILGGVPPVAALLDVLSWFSR